MAIDEQVDYLHCLVPDLLDITRCPFYWGKMDRYEAERLLENRQDGTFLLRDSAQEEYVRLLTPSRRSSLGFTVFFFKNPLKPDMSHVGR